MTQCSSTAIALDSFIGCLQPGDRARPPAVRRHLLLTTMRREVMHKDRARPPRHEALIDVVRPEHFAPGRVRLGRAGRLPARRVHHINSIEQLGQAVRLRDRSACGAGLAFLTAIPIAILGGLIGLGGAEFRLPVLTGPLGYPVRKAVPLNLAVSLTTIIAALLIRGRTLPLAPLAPFWSAMLAMIVGAVVAAFFGVTLAGWLSNMQLERIILVLLLSIGMALIVEGVLPERMPALLPTALAWRIGAGVVFGLAIGLVSSLLGVDGGELLIPTMVFAFGADIKTAGTASLCISLPTVLIGVLRYTQQRAFAARRAVAETVAPLGVGSVIGALVGGLLVGSILAAGLKLSLGAILIVSALRMFRHTRHL